MVHGVIWCGVLWCVVVRFEGKVVPLRWYGVAWLGLHRSERGYFTSVAGSVGLSNKG